MSLHITLTLRLRSHTALAAGLQARSEPMTSMCEGKSEPLARMCVFSEQLVGLSKNTVMAVVQREAQAIS